MYIFIVMGCRRRDRCASRPPINCFRRIETASKVAALRRNSNLLLHVAWRSKKLKMIAFCLAFISSGRFNVRKSSSSSKTWSGFDHSRGYHRDSDSSPWQNPRNARRFCRPRNVSHEIVIWDAQSLSWRSTTSSRCHKDGAVKKGRIF